MKFCKKRCLRFSGPHAGMSCRRRSSRILQRTFASCIRATGNNRMEHVWRKIEELRAQYNLLNEDRVPIDVFTFFEVDLGLDAIGFPSLTSRYRVEAAIKADFTGIYVDQEQYKYLDRGPKFKRAAAAE